jgi:branched-chain amino acid transport system substrate-binding protein
MRACDHQAVLPLYMGTLKKVPQYNFLISSDIVTLPGRDILPTCEEVKKIRGGS